MRNEELKGWSAILLCSSKERAKGETPEPIGEAFSKRVIALQPLRFTRVRGIFGGLCSSKRRAYI